MDDRDFVKEHGLRKRSGCYRRNQSTDRAFDGLARTYSRREFVTANKTAGVVRAGVGKNHHREEHQQ